jgi:lipoate-protein ligase A
VRLRVLDTGLAPARWNVAASAALLASVDAGEDAVLRFHRYPHSCIVGRFQDIEAELDLAACHAEGTALARRLTGGGAVVMGPGILAFDLVLPGGGAALQRVTDGAGEALVAALTDLGLVAARPTPGSVAIGGLKVSGSAGRLARRAVLHQATLILDLADAPPLSLLRRRTEGGRPTADPRHRVTDVTTAMRAIPSPHAEVLAESEPRSTRDGRASFEASLREAPQDEDVTGVLTQRIAATLRLEPSIDTMSDAERAQAATILADTVGRDDFVLTGDVERRAA